MVCVCGKWNRKEKGARQSDGEGQGGVREGSEQGTEAPAEVGGETINGQCFIVPLGCYF